MTEDRERTARTRYANNANRRPNPTLDPDHAGGFGIVDESERPAAVRHKGGSPLDEGDAQYGASPLRSARYAEDHAVNDKHFRDGRPAVQSAMHKGPAKVR